MTGDRPDWREQRRLRVFCRAASHAKKNATVETFKFARRCPYHDEDCGGEAAASYGLDTWEPSACAICVGREWRLIGGGYGSERLDDDRPVRHVDVFGNATRPGNFALSQRTRERWRLVCPLCGLRVDVRRENILDLMAPELAAGASRVPLERLVARVS